MQNVTRFGVSLEQGLLKDFDGLISSQGYSTRSKAIEDLIRDYLLSQTLLRPHNVVIGTLIILYDHHKKNLVNNLLHLQHACTQNVLSTMHIHVDHDNCLEVIIIKGITEKIKSFYHKMKALKGIKHSGLLLTATRE
jgi:CopG family nickel-responsive transcriptional regulator